MKLNILTAGTVGGVERSTATLEVGGATIFFVDGEPVAYLHDGTIYHAGDLDPLLLAFPALRHGSAAHRTNSREVETRLLFRERSANQRLNAAFAGMPYAPILNFETGGGALDFVQITSNVAKLAGFLRDKVIRDEAAAAVCDEHRRAISGVALLLRLAEEWPLPPRPPRPCDGSEG